MEQSRRNRVDVGYFQKKELHNVYKQRKKVAKRVCAQMKAAGSEELYKELDNIRPSAADRDQTSQELHVGSKNHHLQACCPKEKKC